MRCDECLLSLEEYVNGELEAPASGRLAAHIAECGGCESEHAQMQREQEIYARCKVKAPPSLWAAVLERIEEEQSPPASAPFAAPVAWLAHAPGIRQLRRHAGFAAGIIILGGITWLLFGVTRRGDVAQRGVESVAAGGGTIAQAPSRPNDAPALNRLHQDVPESEPKRASARVPPGRQDRTASAVAPRTTLAGGNPRKPTAHGGPPAGNVPGAAAGPSPAGVGPRPPSAVAEIDRETARHLERARMLLRSFKNGRLSEDGPTLDLTYERQLSRELLGKNNILRGDARSEGNEEVERLLGCLEPFLLEIANLGEGPTTEEVRLIKERMLSEGIIVRLSLF